MRWDYSLSRRLLLGAAVLPMSGCSRLDALNGLNALTPGDGKTEQIGQDIAYGSSSRQMLDVYAPTTPGPHPVIVFFYGGSWQFGRRQDYGFAARALAATGHIVVVPDYRLAPAHAYPDFLRDGAAAVQWAQARIAEHGGDPARLAVIGHSAGAYIALMLALDPRWLGPQNPLHAAVGLAGPYDFLPFEPGGAAEIAFGHIRDLRETQPITHVGPGKPAVLLLQGEADDTVFPHNARNLAAALVAAGSDAEMRLYPGLGHIGILLALSKPFRSKAPVIAETQAFLARHLS